MPVFITSKRLRSRAAGWWPEATVATEQMHTRSSYQIIMFLLFLFNANSDECDIVPSLWKKAARFHETQSGKVQKTTVCHTPNFHIQPLNHVFLCQVALTCHFKHVWP